MLPTIFTLPGITSRLQTTASCMPQTTARSLLLEGKTWQRVVLGWNLGPLTVRIFGTEIPNSSRTTMFLRVLTLNHKLQTATCPQVQHGAEDFRHFRNFLDQARPASRFLNPRAVATMRTRARRGRYSMDRRKWSTCRSLKSATAHAATRWVGVATQASGGGYPTWSSGFHSYGLSMMKTRKAAMSARRLRKIRNLSGSVTATRRFQ